MNKKIFMATVLIIAVLAGLGYYYGGDSLQGRFDRTVKNSALSGVKGKASSSSSTATTENYLLTVSAEGGSPGTQTINISSLTTATEEDDWATIGYWELKLEDGAKSCDNMEFAFTNSSGRGGDLSQILDGARLLLRDSSMRAMGTYYDPSDSGLTMFENLPDDTTGTFYVQLDGKPGLDVIDTYMDNKLSIYLIETCVNTTEDSYTWFKNHEDEQIDMNEDSSGLGNIGGYLYVEE